MKTSLEMNENQFRNELKELKKKILILGRSTGVTYSHHVDTNPDPTLKFCGRSGGNESALPDNDTPALQSLLLP